MRNVLLISCAAFASSCSSHSYEPKSLDGFEQQAAMSDALRYLGEGSAVLAVCGGSTGQSWYFEEDARGPIPDGIGNGVIVFALRSDGKPEILTRDVTREMIVTSEDGGVITRLYGRQNDQGLGVWVVNYASSGVTQSHNLAVDWQKQLSNIWTQNKPAIENLPARASMFRSQCEIIL